MYRTLGESVDEAFGTGPSCRRPDPGLVVCVWRVPRGARESYVIETEANPLCGVPFSGTPFWRATSKDPVHEWTGRFQDGGASIPVFQDVYSNGSRRQGWPRQSTGTLRGTRAKFGREGCGEGGSLEARGVVNTPKCLDCVRGAFFYDFEGQLISRASRQRVM